ncbi:hypothetical protein BT96DRAFT_912381 [Gymnopus androsaceus JB14]|uniref:Phosphatidylglycerol/phosphatidylinositol transfer protein n=1 Tax=Gymnopus androsaceus JB14 TaxID=1447944 RepID=A0A6A4IKQ3_9AGAR|nr:hypothetical protein BT96DRAFT_912381 [Gymnopus androsaceus JB14]
MLRSSLLAAAGFYLISLTSAGSLVPQIAFNADNAPSKWSWKDCGLETDAVRIESIAISPDPPLAGEAFDCIFSAHVGSYAAAYCLVKVKLGLIQLLKKEFDVCEEAENANATVQCPVEKGHYVVAQTVDLPKEIPPAKFHISVNGWTVDEEDMVCMNLEIDFTKKFW